jgi:hypothetical protein
MDRVEQHTLLTWSTSVILPPPNFHECQRIISDLEEDDCKPVVVLVRYGVIPKPSDTTLWGKLTETLFHLLYYYDERTRTLSLSLNGLQFFAVSTRPVISSSIISMVLSRIPTPDRIEALRIQSISKELSVMESTPRPATIAWNHFFDPSLNDYSIGEGIPPNPDMTYHIRRSLTHFRRQVSDRIIWPYSTRRGISQETSRIYMGSVQHIVKPWFDVDRDLNSPISSRDVVAYFLHYGSWIPGYCEMKQRWYPSGLTPRTYFAQGGDAIRVSCYLREFFNDLCDCFIPTERYMRVDGSRLITYDDGYFFIYDLTSFTSNFHEQYSFLCHTADFFRGTNVFCVSTGLTLVPSDLGDLIMEYADTINLNPRYQFSPKILVHTEGLPPPVHKVAGFLGVPGNLATCTLAHGLLISQHLSSVENQSTAGDDGCVGCRNDEHQHDIENTIQLLGIFQSDKGSTTRFQQAASYLKRRFSQVNHQAVMFERVEFIMLSLVNSVKNTDPRFPEISYSPSKLRSSIAKASVQLIRSLFLFTQGVYLTGEREYIMDFLSYVYRVVDLPKGGQLRGMLFDDCDSIRQVQDSLVFPLDSDYLQQDPDVLISERFLPWVVAFPEITDTICSDYSGPWLPGESRTFRMSPHTEKLVKYGWLRRQMTPKRYIVGEDARKFFRRLMKDEIRNLEYEYTCLIPLSVQVLEDLQVYKVGSLQTRKSLGVYGSYGKSYTDLDTPYASVNALSTEQLSHRYMSSLQASQSIGIEELDY